MKKRWEVLSDFPMYVVSTYGEIMSIYRNKPISQRTNNRGIRIVSLTDEESHTQVTRSVALLVVETFLTRPRPLFNSPIHLDGVKSNCRLDNLMWRPRWFAYKFHQQFEDPRFYHQGIELGIEGSRERFNGWALPSMRYGLLYKAIINSYHNYESVFPTGQIFRNLSW